MRTRSSWRSSTRRKCRNFRWRRSGIGLSFLLQQLDKSFHSLDDLRQLGLPVVGGISLVRAAIPMKRRLIAASSFAVAVLLLCMVYGGLMWRLLNTPGVA
jgi:hypothetical protein